MNAPYTNTMYLTPVTESEIFNTVNQCKNKTSEDANSLSMKIIKSIICHGSKAIRVYL